MSYLQVMSAEVCPFAQRTLILLGEKGLDYTHREVDLRNKPDWFEAASPYSKVPVLVHGQSTIYESSIINEYLEEVFPAPSFMPADPVARSTVRVWIDFDNVKFVPAFYKILLARDEERRQRLAGDLLGYFRFIESEVMRKRTDGSYWLGETYSLADIAIYPHFERVSVL